MTSPATETTAIKVTRAVGPWGCGLAGFVDDKLAIVVPVQPKSAYRWLRGGVTKRDRERVADAIEGGAA